MRFWLSIILLTYGAGLAPAQSFPDSLHVAAFPHLNVRSADRSAIVGTLPDGRAIASERLARTGEQETIQGLAGEWLALDDTLRVFDAYLWIADPPRLDRIEYGEPQQFAWEGEPLLDYGRRVVGSPDIPVFRTINEDYGGPGGDTYELEVIASAGAALNIFRRLLICAYDPDRMPSPYADMRESFDRALRIAWNGEEPLSFSWGSEGGGFSLIIRPNDAAKEGYILSFSMGTC